MSGLSSAGASISVGGSDDVTTLDFVNIVVTPAGTTGDRTINATAGSVNFAAAAISLIVTNNLANPTSVIFAQVGSDDATLKTVTVTHSSGAFTLKANAAATGETRVNFMVIN